jgi:hypothetical protein
MAMIRRLLMLGLLAMVVGVVVRSAPDIARYLKIREM